MAVNNGWVKLHRIISDNKLWLREKFTSGQAWVDLIMIANHKQSTITVRGIPVTINRGQVGFSEVSLANRWKWSRNKVRRFLDYLQLENMVDKSGTKMEQQTIQQNGMEMEQQNKFVVGLLSIVNYDKYQGNDTANETAERNENDTANDTLTIKYKNNKKIKNNTPPTPKGELREMFDQFWAAYPRRVAKGTAEKCWMRIKPDGELFETILSAVERYADDCRDKEDKYIAHPSTWLNGKRWEDETKSKSKFNDLDRLGRVK